MVDARHPKTISFSYEYHFSHQKRRRPMDLSLQKQYIEAYTERKKKELFERESKPLLSEKWQLADSYKVDKSLSVKCEYPHPNSKSCGKAIQNIYVIKSETGKLLKIGGTCLENILDIKKLKHIEKEEEKLNDSLTKAARNAENYAQKAYTPEEKEIILKNARAVNLIPSDYVPLLAAAIPLPNQLYRQLEQAVEVFRKERLIAAEMEKQRNQNRFVPQPYRPVQQPYHPAGQATRIVQPTKEYSSVIDWIERTNVMDLNSRQNAGRVIKSVFFYHLNKEKIPHVLFSDLLKPIVAHYALSEAEASELQVSFCDECKRIAQGYRYSITSNGLSDFYMVR
jgi:hypothetical protein